MNEQSTVEIIACNARTAAATAKHFNNTDEDDDDDEKKYSVSRGYSPLNEARQ